MPEQIQEIKESASYQAMLSRVEKLITEMSQENVDLDALVTKVEEGYALIRGMRERLDATKGKLEKLRQQNEDSLGEKSPVKNDA